MKPTTLTVMLTLISAACTGELEEMDTGEESDTDTDTDTDTEQVWRTLHRPLLGHRQQQQHQQQQRP